jgi:hypothetical protein
MKRNKIDCNHSGAIPWINNQGGFAWCADCGAVRTLKMTGPSAFNYATDHWLYPTGREDARKQLERMKSK